MVHDSDKTHYFSHDEQLVIREWMKALIKSTITRDFNSMFSVRTYVIDRAYAIVRSRSFVQQHSYDPSDRCAGYEPITSPPIADSPGGNSTRT